MYLGSFQSYISGKLRNLAFISQIYDLCLRFHRVHLKFILVHHLIFWVIAVTCKLRHGAFLAGVTGFAIKCIKVKTGNTVWPWRSMFVVWVWLGNFFCLSFSRLSLSLSPLISCHLSAISSLLKAWLAYINKKKGTQRTQSAAVTWHENLHSQNQIKYTIYTWVHDIYKMSIELIIRALSLF